MDPFGWRDPDIPRVSVGPKGLFFLPHRKMSGAPTRSHVWLGRWAGAVSAAQGGWGLASFRLRKFRPKSTGAAMGFGEQRFCCDVWADGQLKEAVHGCSTRSAVFAMTICRTSGMCRHAVVFCKNGSGMPRADNKNTNQHHPISSSPNLRILQSFADPPNSASPTTPPHTHMPANNNTSPPVSPGLAVTLVNKNKRDKTAPAHSPSP